MSITTKLIRNGSSSALNAAGHDDNDSDAQPVPPAEVVRSLVARATTPLLPDDYLHLLNPLWSARELRGRVVAVTPETDDAATLEIKPGWGWNFKYQAGQYVGIGVHVGGKWHWRSYSISSSPVQGGSRARRRHLTVTVKAMPEGFLSEHLVRGLLPGTIIRLALPRGEFVLPEPPAIPLVVCRCDWLGLSV